MPKHWDVTVPIAGHAVVTVESESKEEAINAAFGVVELKHIESFEALHQFSKGNVCYCPSPWKADAEPSIGEEDDDA